MIVLEPPRGTFPYINNEQYNTRVATKLDTPSSVQLDLEIFQPCHSPHFIAPLHPPIICRAKAIAPSALDFFYVSCRLLTRPHFPTDSVSFLQTRITYLRCSPARSRWPSSLHAVKPLYIARHPRGTGPVTGHPVTSRSARAESEYRWPTWLRPTRIRSPVTSLLGSGHSDTGRIQARADSDPSVQSRHMTLTTTTPPGPGYIPPARMHAPAGQAQSSRCPRMRTQQATEGVRRGYHDKAYVGARLKLYVQRALELSYTGRASHTMAPAVWHTVTSCRNTCRVRTPPSASHRYVSTHLRPCLPINVHIRATSEGAS